MYIFNVWGSEVFIEHSFYAEGLGDRIHCTFIFTFFVSLSCKSSLHTVTYQILLSNTNNLYTDVWFQEFLSNNNMVSRNYFYLILIICTQLYKF